MFVKLVILLAAAALLVGFAARSSHGAGPARHYVVRPGDTLWSIAEKTYGGDVREAIWNLEQRNHLTTATIIPGEKLVLP